MIFSDEGRQVSDQSQIGDSSPRVDVLLFGGAFDPPHLGHTTVVREILEQRRADQVIIMPVGQHPFDKALSPAPVRLGMVELAFHDLLEQFPERLTISTYELKQQHPSYTVETLRWLVEQYPVPESRFGLLIGSDNLSQFSTWRESELILELATVLIYPREMYPVTEADLQPGMQLLENVSTVRCSSTELRHQLSSGRATPHLDPLVRRYLEVSPEVEYAQSRNIRQE